MASKKYFYQDVVVDNQYMERQGINVRKYGYTKVYKNIPNSDELIYLGTSKSRKSKYLFDDDGNKIKYK